MKGLTSSLLSQAGARRTCFRGEKATDPQGEEKTPWMEMSESV